MPSYDIPTARRRVCATALRSPLQLSTELVEFKLPSMFFDLKIEDVSGRIMVSLYVFSVYLIHEFLLEL